MRASVDNMYLITYDVLDREVSEWRILRDEPSCLRHMFQW